MSRYYRPLAQHGTARPENALSLAGGPLWFTHAEVLERGGAARVIAASRLPGEARRRLCTPRAAILGMDLAQPQIMGIVNVTPDSFSDGGVHEETQTAVQGALKMAQEGAAVIDIGGESTRPGAADVSEGAEIARTAPVIAAIRAQSAVPVSIDTRKTGVARAATEAGANLVNDVSGFAYDADLAPFCAGHELPVCVMHALGEPATMQDNPIYDNVLLDVFDVLEGQISALEAAGIPRGRIIADPGIGFGKTAEHNLTLLRNISLFHGLGCAVLLGASRKRFIGTIGGEPVAARRVSGSVAVGLAALAQGVQILRVHDVRETVQALRLWQSVRS